MMTDEERTKVFAKLIRLDIVKEELEWMREREVKCADGLPFYSPALPYFDNVIKMVNYRISRITNNANIGHYPSFDL